MAELYFKRSKKNIETAAAVSMFKFACWLMTDVLQKYTGGS
jgi:hypothetical protein